jgi:hypothetical protein
MAVRMGRQRRSIRRGRQGRPRSRAAGCLIWVLILLVIVLVLWVLFGGFQKGTKVGSGPVPVLVGPGSARG